MITVSATKFRSNLFAYLEKAAEGETIIIQRNHRDIAKLTAPSIPDWRNRMQRKPRLLVPVAEFIEPMQDVWEDYI